MDWTAIVDWSVFILILIAWINIKILNDYFYIVFDNRWHVTDATFRVMMSLWIFYKQAGLHWWVLFAAGVFLSIYWIWFDIGLNKKRGLNWDYVGNHSYMDKYLLKKLERPIFIKIALLAVCIMMTVILKK